MTREKIIDFIIRVEFTEWNSIFVYFIRLLQGKTTMFQHVAATIESHKRKAKRFLEDLPDELKVQSDIWELPDIWDKNILIVENDSAIQELLSDVLKGNANVENAANCMEGLEKIGKTFYNVVVSKTDLPAMSGIDFFQKAVEVNPKIHRQFLFYTDKLTAQTNTFLKENLVPHLERPFGLKRLIQTVNEIMDKTL